MLVSVSAAVQPAEREEKVQETKQKQKESRITKGSSAAGRNLQCIPGCFVGIERMWLARQHRRR